MKICLLAHNPKVGTAHGINRYSVELINGLKKCHELTILQEGNISNFFDILLKEIILWTKVLKVRCDVYHATSPFIALGILMARKYPSVVTIHDLIPYKNSITSFYQKHWSVKQKLNFTYMRFCIKMAVKSNYIIVPFNITKIDLLNIFKLNERKIKVIPYGVDLTFFHPLTENPLEDKYNKREKYFIFFIGGFNAGKGCDILLRAFAIVKKKYKNCKLLIGGKWCTFDGFRLIKELGIYDDVIFLGHIPEEELVMYYNLCDTFVFPSRIGFCLQILEAMACGKPVITINTPDIQEVTGGAAILLDSLEPERCASSIIELLSDESRREKLGLMARKRAELFSWENTINKTEMVYQEII